MLQWSEEIYIKDICINFKLNTGADRNILLLIVINSINKQGFVTLGKSKIVLVVLDERQTEY